METVESLKQEIVELRAKLKALSRPPKEKKQVRHQRQIRCSLCGAVAKRAEMNQISKYEYQHEICPTKPKVIRIDFN